MSFATTPTSGHCLPRVLRDKNGRPVLLQRLEPDAGNRLIDMYLAFQPRNSFQGLPPLKDEACVRWVRDILAAGIHVVAEKRTGMEDVVGKEILKWNALSRQPPPSPAHETLVGHAALFPISQQKCEMLVVVCPGYQNLGIGTELVRSCIDLAGELGFQRIWLPVDAINVRARHVYRKCGFEYVSDRQGRELDMTCEVHARGPAFRGDAPCVVFPIPAPHFHVPDVLHV
jgi:GNAT superfamily N-acetyltransferase